MNLVWKLLRQHISIAQFAGFFIANLLGMLIVLMSVQFYSDVAPAFTSSDSFIKPDYLIVSKQVNMLQQLAGGDNSFTAGDIEEIKHQDFCKDVGEFTSSQYKVSASIGLKGMQGMSTEMFFESVPGHFVDTDHTSWHFTPGQREVPIILPRSYLAIYNFGFAQGRSLPQLSEGAFSMLRLSVTLRGDGKSETLAGRVIGFSNRLNTILVPEEFMHWSNNEFASLQNDAPTRLIVEVNNPTNPNIAQFLKSKGYETNTDKLDAGRTTYFLKVVSGIVLVIGLLISALSFYILMLSIYLLVQKNSSKLENLLLIGYSPLRVSMPYQLLTIGMNLAVFILALIAVVMVRGYYMDILLSLFPTMPEGTLSSAIVVGISLLVLVCIINSTAITFKVKRIWNRKD